MTLDYITLSPEETGKLLAAGNADAVMVYLYMKASGDFALRRAAAELHLTESALEWATALLGRLGLMNLKSPQLRYQKEKAPVYTSEAVTNFAAGEPNFLLLQAEVGKRMGRLLSPEEMKTLLSFRDYLKLPPEVITMALTCCIQKNEYYNKSRGAAKTVSMRTLERECYDWANRGINTLELAAAYIGKRMEQLEPVSQVKRALGIEHELVESEREYIESWLAMGFPVESIRTAYERTIIQTGKLAWNYLNKILLNWHEKGLHTLLEIEGENKKTGSRAGTAAAGAVFVPGEGERAAVENLQKFRDSLLKEETP